MAVPLRTWTSRGIRLQIFRDGQYGKLYAIARGKFHRNGVVEEKDIPEREMWIEMETREAVCQGYRQTSFRLSALSREQQMGILEYRPDGPIAFDIDTHDNEMPAVAHYVPAPAASLIIRALSSRQRISMNLHEENVLDIDAADSA